jgi:alkanesulfonate monooxygenase SsuD/methylene tetrahydromethanopterin reductase-like flavin-dependent oxidoreductase (luciferase family)
MSIAIGLTLPTWPRVDRSYATWPELRQLARDAEAMGVDTLWVPDHLLRELGSGERIGFWECWTIVTALAEATTTVGIGPHVACTGFRNPALLAKMATTLDEVSGGRLVLGLGSGVPATDASWRAFGYDPVRHVQRFAESVEVIARLLRGETLTFDGDLVRTEGSQLLPRATVRQAPPVWVAAKGDRTSRIAARWADAINVNVPLTSAADAAGIAARAQAACMAVDRDPKTLQLTGWARLVIDHGGRAIERDGCLSGTPEEVGAACAAFADAGVTHLTLYVGDPDDPSRMPALIPATLARLGPFLEAIRIA